MEVSPPPHHLIATRAHPNIQSTNVFCGKKRPQPMKPIQFLRAGAVLLVFGGVMYVTALIARAQQSTAPAPTAMQNVSDPASSTPQ
jgi:hypothetical protein